MPPLPHELRCQDQRAPSYADELWEVEWGAIPDELMERKASWNWQPQPQLQPGCQIFCVPMLMQLPATQNSGMAACVVTNYTPSTGVVGNGQSDHVVADACKDKTAAAAEKGKKERKPPNPTATKLDDAMPVDYDGELPSVGSVGHVDGSCKRCAFFPKGRCNNGKDCTHCHFEHLPRSRLRKSGTAKARQQQKGASDEVEVEDTVEADEIQVEASDVAPKAVDGLSASSSTESLVKDTTALKASSGHHKEDSTEVDTSVPSVSALSDGEEGTTRTRLTSESSDSDAPNPKPAQEPSSPVPTRKRDSLAKSPNSWAAQQRSRKSSFASKDLCAADLGRMVRALLNKLTEERFDLLASQILALPLSTPEELDVMAAEIFEKATTQDGFRSLYTDLCLRLNTHLAEQTTSVGGKAFRKALVNACQATFEANLQPPDAAVFADLVGDELFEAEVKLKTRRLGNMRFIGELLTQRLLAPKLMLPIVHQLIDGDDAALESLIALLTIISPTFDQKDSLYQAPLKDAFATLRRKSSSKDVCSRLRCQITDLLEARARGWVARST